jgi:hypothetical protein
MRRKFTNVKRYKTSIGRSCMHCGRSATVTATRHLHGKKLPIRLCEDHAELIISN